MNRFFLSIVGLFFLIIQTQPKIEEVFSKPYTQEASWKMRKKYAKKIIKFFTKE
jgi:hypothetical protein